jgi:hypothetical protein
MSHFSNREVHSLAFLTLSSFVASFLLARAFTTLAPTTVVVTGGIHFHHFWYGLSMVVASGWLSIVSNHPEFDRIYAIVFGLGAGLIGDEVGLLLTLGNYQSGLTYVFFVGVLSISGIIYMLWRYREQLEKGVLSLGAGERLVHTGVFIAGLSAVAWAFGHFDLGFVVLSLGVLVAVSGFLLHRKKPARL